jgi:hypothetical protein
LKSKGWLVVNPKMDQVGSYLKGSSDLAVKLPSKLGTYASMKSVYKDLRFLGASPKEASVLAYIVQYSHAAVRVEWEDDEPEAARNEQLELADLHHLAGHLLETWDVLMEYKPALKVMMSGNRHKISAQARKFLEQL